MKNDLKINILRIKQIPLKTQDISLNLPLDSEIFEYLPHKPAGKAEIRGLVTSTENFLKVNLTVRLPMEFVCNRCASSFKKNLFFSFEEMFWDEEDEAPQDVYTYSGNFLDLSEVIRDKILENIETTVLCREDCKGLCVKCGANLNYATCEC